MTNSSAQTSYSSGLTDSDTISITGISGLSGSTTIDFSNIGTISLDNSYTSNYISSGAANTITIGQISTMPTIDISNMSKEYSVYYPLEWENCLPDLNRIQKMCDEYPALKIAFERFKTTYKLVQDDFDTPPEKRIKP